MVIQILNYLEGFLRFDPLIQGHADPRHEEELESQDGLQEVVVVKGGVDHVEGLGNCSDGLGRAHRHAEEEQTVELGPHQGEILWQQGLALSCLDC